METTINQDETFAEVSKITNISPDILEAQILKNIKDNNISYLVRCDWGWSLQEICEEEGVTITQLINILFPDQPDLIKNTDINNLIGNLLIFGDGDCEHCGGKKYFDNENSGENTDIYKCDNCDEQFYS